MVMRRAVRRELRAADGRGRSSSQGARGAGGFLLVWLARVVTVVVVSLTAVVGADDNLAANPAPAAAVTPTPQPPLREDAGLSFIRVHVPPGRLAEISPAGVQYVPMEAAEFEEAVRQFTAQDGSRIQGLPRPAADLVRYRVRLDESGRLLGQVEFAVGTASPGPLPISLPVGQIDLRDCRWRPIDQKATEEAEPAGERAGGLQPEGAAALTEGSEVDLFGLPDGTVELRVPGEGIVSATVITRPSRGQQPQTQAVPLAGGQPEFFYRLPLVPALSTTLLLDLPTDLEPHIAGCRGRLRSRDGSEAAADDRQVWEFAFGPRDTVDLTLAAISSPRLFVWSAVHCGRRLTELTVMLEPSAAWTRRELTLIPDPRFRFTRFQMVPTPDDADRARAVIPVEQVSDGITPLSVRLPVEALGQRWPLSLRAVVPTAISPRNKPSMAFFHLGNTRKHRGFSGLRIAASGSGRLFSQPARTADGEWFPGLEVEAGQWAGGGLLLTAASDLQWRAIEPADCLPIPAEEASRWPLLDVAGAVSSEDSSPQTRPRLAFELQQPGAGVQVAVAPREPDLDIARVTTIDVTTAAVIGRAACDIRVRRGSIHRLEAAVGESWFIDSVEPLGTPAGEQLAITGDSGTDRPAVTGSAAEQSGSAGPQYDWKVVRERTGDRLILDLPTAVTVDRQLRLRITGHRGGIAAGGRFSSADVDMVRVLGEATDQAWIDLQTSSDTTLQEIGGGEEDDAPALPPRLLSLTEGGGWRQRIAGGALTPPREFRLLLRRPPLEVETQARFTVRGDRLNETYSFVCQPLQGQLDAVTVHFSEPVGDLDWSVLATRETAVFARRLDPVDRGDRESPVTSPWPAATSWRIELTPPVAGSGTLRATAARPFTGPLPLPLAWVESAVSARGEALVQAVGQERPLVRNSWLTELPPRDRQADASLETVTELAYDLANAGGGPGPAAELIPAPAASQPAARAWVWREQTIVRCYDSAAAEFETRFDVENDGRETLQLSLPAEHRLLGVSVGGERLPLVAATAGALPVYLPLGARRLTITVRTATLATPRFGLWQLGTDVPTVDAPTLTRDWRLLLPESLTVAAVARGFREIAGPRPDWAGRLVGGVARLAEASPSTVTGGVDQAFRSRRFVPVGGRYERQHFLVVGRMTLLVAAGLVAVLLAGLAAAVSWRRSWLLVAAGTVIAVGTLWVPEPLDVLLRAGLWAGVAVAVLRLRGIFQPSGWQPLVFLTALLLQGAAAGEEPPLRVFLTPVDRGETALVPQPLFRVLAAAETVAGRPSTRLLDCRLEVQARRQQPAGTTEIWWCNLLVESDTATVLSLDQTPTESRFAALPIRLDGGVVRASLSSDRRRLTVPLPAAGRHTVAIPVEPTWVRRGDLEVADVRLPVSPASRVTLAAEAASRRRGRSLLVEWSADGLVFQPVDDSRGGEFSKKGYRLPAARQVRFIRSVDPEASLVTAIREATSRNRLAWDAAACRLTAEFTIDVGPAILPSVWLQADPRLVPAESAAADQPTGMTADYEVVAVAPGVFRIDRRTPMPGLVRVEIPFTMPLVSPVGIFDLPDVWLRRVRLDHRELLVSAAADLDLTVRFPGSAAPPLLEDSFDGVSWSADVIETNLESTASGSTGGSGVPESTNGMPPLVVQRQPVVLEVVRRPTPVRGRQQLEILTGNRATQLRYEAAIDAVSSVWAEDSLQIPNGFEIESCQLFQRPDDTEAADVGPAVDLVLRREKAGRRRLVLQRPRPGRYLLRLKARRSEPLPKAGPLPLVRSEVAAALPYSVIWTDRGRRGRPELLEAAVGRDQPRGGFSAAEGAVVTSLAGTATDDREAAASETWRIELPVNKAEWRYRMVPTAEPAAAPRPPIAGDAPAEQPPAAEPEPVASRAAITLADTELVVDERGRMAGIGRFDLVTAAAEVELTLPAGYRLFELLVDGRQVQPRVPAGNGPDDRWAVPLQPGPWPREIVIVFVGEIGSDVMRGEPIAFAPPRLGGLPVERVIWTLHYPAGRGVLVAGMGRTATAAEAGRIRSEAAAVIERLLGKLAGGESFAALSRIGRYRSLRQFDQPPLEAWASADRREGPARGDLSRLAVPLDVGEVGSDPRWSRVTLFPDPETPEVTVRFVAEPAGNVGRVAATLLVLLAGAGGWWSVTRRPGRTLMAAARWWPVALGLGAIVWLLARQPPWPGLLVLAATAATLAERWRQFRRLPPQGAPAEAETTEDRGERQVGASSVTRTAIRQGPAE